MCGFDKLRFHTFPSWFIECEVALEYSSCAQIRFFTAPAHTLYRFIQIFNLVMLNRETRLRRLYFF